MLLLAIWLVLAQLDVLRNWKETEAYKDDVTYLRQSSIDPCEIAPPCTRCGAWSLLRNMQIEKMPRLKALSSLTNKFLVRRAPVRDDSAGAG